MELLPELLLFVFIILIAIAFYAIEKNTRLDCKIISFEDNILTVEIIKPKCLLDLLEYYGTGPDGFDEDLVEEWRNEDFAKNVPEAGTYKINIEEQLTKLKYSEQDDNLPGGWDFPHTAVLSEAILKYYQETDVHLLEDWASRTSLTDLDGNHILAGCFDSDGIGILIDCDDVCDPGFGVTPSRKV